jgi:hypothetical protein
MDVSSSASFSWLINWAKAIFGIQAGFAGSNFFAPASIAQARSPGNILPAVIAIEGCSMPDKPLTGQVCREWILMLMRDRQLTDVSDLVHRKRHTI